MTTSKIVALSICSGMGGYLLGLSIYYITKYIYRRRNRRWRGDE